MDEKKHKNYIILLDIIVKQKNSNTFRKPDPFGLRSVYVLFAFFLRSHVVHFYVKIA